MIPKDRPEFLPTGQRQGALRLQPLVSDRFAEELELAFRKILAKRATPRQTQRRA